MNTPEFLVWAIEYRCPVRGFQDGSDPERTERQLRAARAVSAARREGRVFEGVCVQPPDGFRIDEALAMYGGLAAVEQACGGCPANAMQRVNDQSLAGCFGHVPLPPSESEFHEAIERAIERMALASEVERLFPPAQPRWYGLWMQSPISAGQAAVIERLLTDVESNHQECNRSLAEFTLALRTARAGGLRLHHALYPRGFIEWGWWRLVPHCAVCRAPSKAALRGKCDVCGGVNKVSVRKRHARGRRPYFPLDRLLGTERAQEFLVRYAAFRAQQESPGRERSQRQPTPPDNPPAG